MNDQPPHDTLAAAASAQTGAGAESPFGATTADGGGGSRAGKTQACEKFRLALYDNDQGGWSALQVCGLAEIFRTRTHQRGGDHFWELTADGFFNYCVSGSTKTSTVAVADPPLRLVNFGEDALADLLTTLETFEYARPGSLEKMRGQSAWRVLHSLIFVFIENWVACKACCLPLEAGEFVGRVRLGLDEPWLVYIAAATHFGLQGSIPSPNVKSPPALVEVLMPAAAPDDLMAPVLSALGATMGIAEGFSTINNLRNHIGKHKVRNPDDMILAVCHADTGNSLMQSEIQARVYVNFGIPITVFGADGKNSSAEEFYKDLMGMIASLQEYFYPPTTHTKPEPAPTPASESAPKPPGNPSMPNITINNHIGSTSVVHPSGETLPVTNNHFHAPVNGPVVQASGQNSQAAFGNISNQSASSKELTAALAAFDEVLTDTAMKRTILNEIDGQVKALNVLNNAGDHGPETVKHARSLLDNLTAYVIGVEKTGKLFDRLRVVAVCVGKAWSFVVNWPPSTGASS